MTTPTMTVPHTAHCQLTSITFPVLPGRYKLPWDMTTPAHRQLNPAYVLRKGAAFLQEATDVLRRRARGEPDQVCVLGGGGDPSVPRSVFLVSPGGSKL